MMSGDIRCIDKLDESGWLQSRLALPANKPTGKKRGRPSSPDAYVYITIGLRPFQWEWLALWFPNGSPSDQVRALLDRALKFWPVGPGRFR